MTLVANSVLDPEGRVVRSELGDPLGAWEVWFGEGRDGSVRRRWLLAAVCELYGLGDREFAPAWMLALRDDLASLQTSLGRRFACPCCDHFTIDRIDASADCRVCGWEDDLFQYRRPDEPKGANAPSLIDARAHFAVAGVSDERRRHLCRPPLPEEMPPRGVTS